MKDEIVKKTKRTRLRFETQKKFTVRASYAVRTRDLSLTKGALLPTELRRQLLVTPLAPPVLKYEADFSRFHSLFPSLVRSIDVAHHVR